MTAFSKSIFLGLLVTTITACGGASFGGGSKQVKSPGGETSTSGGTSGDQDALGDPSGPGGEPIMFTGKLNGEEKALNKCLAQWNDHPFSKQDIAKYRKISASVNVLSNSKGIVDDETTSEPKLILVTASVNVLGSPEYDFLNPNGWYCIKVGVNVQTNLTINAHCSARLADSKVNVNVLSDSRPTAGIGVDVLSDVKVNRVGKACE